MEEFSWTLKWDGLNLFQAGLTSSMTSSLAVLTHQWPQITNSSWCPSITLLLFWWHSTRSKMWTIVSITMDIMVKGLVTWMSQVPMLTEKCWSQITRAPLPTSDALRSTMIPVISSQDSYWTERDLTGPWSTQTTLFPMSKLASIWI